MKLCTDCRKYKTDSVEASGISTSVDTMDYGDERTDVDDNALDYVPKDDLKEHLDESFAAISMSACKILRETLLAMFKEKFNKFKRSLSK